MVRKLRLSANTTAAPKKRKINAGEKQRKERKQSKKSTMGFLPPPGLGDGDVDPEDAELERLERLLGISEGKSQTKLNKEFADEEGLGDDFGDFLSGLDELESSVKKKKSSKPEVIDSVPDVVVDGASSMDEEDVSDAEEEGEDSGTDYERDDGDAYSDDAEEDVALTLDESYKESVYRPASGEDIYGRSVDEQETSTETKKYVPPSLRKKENNTLAVIDESSVAVKNIRRQMNGLLNRLSDSSKDSIVRSVKNIFDSSSLNICCHVLNDCIMAACGNPTQIMTTLIPIYGSLVAALHFSIGIDVGAFIVEQVVTKLHQSIIEDQRQQNSSSSHSLISDKLPLNLLLLLVYLYNLRVIHHELIIDIMNTIAKPTGSAGDISELSMDLLTIAVDHSGSRLRGDDPVSLRDIQDHIATRLKSIRDTSDGQSRMKFIFEAFVDMKNNKSKRSAHKLSLEMVKELRKWVGSTKTQLGTKHGGDISLRVTLVDLLDADRRGRWWKTGASWSGNKNINTVDGSTGTTFDDTSSSSGGLSTESTKSTVSTPAAPTMEQQLIELAKKMNFITSTKQNIFVVVMSSRNVDDCFERLMRMELKGKQDREIVKVLVDCCVQEKAYNAYYAEVGCLLCSHNRQYKTTFQFTFWDSFKTLAADYDLNSAVKQVIPEKKCINLGHMVAHFVKTFHVPISVIKCIDVGELTPELLLFLNTLFLQLFSSQISAETFQTIFDRIATTKDYGTIREMILIYLQQNLTSIPQHMLGKDVVHSEKKAMEKRRKMVIKTMQDMSILDMVRKDEDEFTRPPDKRDEDTFDSVVSAGETHTKHRKRR